MFGRKRDRRGTPRKPLKQMATPLASHRQRTESDRRATLGENRSANQTQAFAKRSLKQRHLSKLSPRRRDFSFSWFGRIKHWIEKTNLTATKTPLGQRVDNSSHGFGIFWHAQAEEMLSTIKRLWSTPWSTTMTCLVIGIALSLPLVFFLSLINLQLLTNDWQGQPKISVYLEQSLAEIAAESRRHDLRNRLLEKSLVDAVEYISPDQGLAEFQRTTGIKEMVNSLDKNPLPGVFLLSLKADASASNISELLNEIKVIPGIDVAEFDLLWQQRLYGWLALGQRLVYGLMSLLAVAVLLIIANTVRLVIENRRDEIEITKLVGATDGFVQRPFLYLGMGYGFVGGLMACFILSAFEAMIISPLMRLNFLYQFDFHFQGLGFSGHLSLMLSAMGLGLIGAFWSVRQHLNQLALRENMRVETS